MELLESTIKTLMYWLFGLIYIGVLMGVSWMINQIFGDGTMTFAEAFIAAAIVFVPIVVGKVMTSRDE